MNLYQYCGNDPVNWVDPWGLFSRKIGFVTNPLWNIARNISKKTLTDYFPNLSLDIINSMAEAMADVATLEDKESLERIAKELEIIKKKKKCERTEDDIEKFKKLIDESRKLSKDLMNKLRKQNPTLPWDLLEQHGERELQRAYEEVVECPKYQMFLNRNVL